MTFNEYVYEGLVDDKLDTSLGLAVALSEIQQVTRPQVCHYPSPVYGLLITL